MKIASCVTLIAIGAILKFAVTASVAGVDLQTVGVILMIAGVAALILTFVYDQMNARNAGQDRRPPPPPPMR
ncbi:MAG: DUF6458 family protein [Solirubrobacteraceae bacterium]